MEDVGLTKSSRIVRMSAQPLGTLNGSDPNLVGTREVLWKEGGCVHHGSNENPRVNKCENWEEPASNVPSGKTDVFVGPSEATDFEKHVESHSLVEVQVVADSGSLESSSQSVSIEPCFDPSTGLYSVRPKILKGFNKFKPISPGLYLNKSWRFSELGKSSDSILESSRRGLKKVDIDDVEITNEGLSRSKKGGHLNNVTGGESLDGRMLEARASLEEFSLVLETDCSLLVDWFGHPVRAPLSFKVLIDLNHCSGNLVPLKIKDGSVVRGAQLSSFDSRLGRFDGNLRGYRTAVSVLG
ncbi:hypothetical protein V6N11_057650 [Hibiscus sabdariffa]|uniref:Uncharacterized protein n=1 Tax=Hibiscus sabdariffa TaxID=183260 RepID=A0ABR2NII9_9ROSI